MSEADSIEHLGQDEEDRNINADMPAEISLEQIRHHSVTDQEQISGDGRRRARRARRAI